MNIKIKGISMSVYTDAEIKSLKENGNKVSLNRDDPHLEPTTQIDGELECKARPRAW